jgi:hypothetical protein
MDNSSFNPPAVKRQVYGYALVFALEHAQVLAKKFGPFQNALQT